MIKRIAPLIALVLLLPALASGFGGGLNVGGGSSSTPFNAGTVQTFTNEVAYAGNGSTLSFSGYTVLHPLVSIDTTNGGNVTVNWTHATVANSQTVSTTGTFAANSDLSSGSITAAGALTLIFLASHAPDNGTNITVTYTRGIQCNFANTSQCNFNCAIAGIGGKWTLFNPLNLPSAAGNGGALTFTNVTAGSCFGGVTYDSNFWGPNGQISGLTYVSWAGTGQPYSANQNCFYGYTANGTTNVIANTDGTKIFINLCGTGGPLYQTNVQVGVGDFFGDMFFHNHLKFQVGGLTCGSVAGCGSGTLGTCTAGAFGTITPITDSTAVATEGQACAGNSTHEAMAFCGDVSGTPTWKCF